MHWKYNLCYPLHTILDPSKRSIISHSVTFYRAVSTSYLATDKSLVRANLLTSPLALSSGSYFVTIICVSGKTISHAAGRPTPLSLTTIPNHLLTIHVYIIRPLHAPCRERNLLPTGRPTASRRTVICDK